MMNDEIAYQQALDYLYSFIDYSLTRSFRYSAEKFDLTRMVALLDSLGNPQRDYPILHVAGTKGKGSICSLCANVFRTAGYKTGLYTSPHLVDFTERIQIDGINITHGELADLVAVIKPHVEKIYNLTTFEISTALSFLYFSKKKVDTAVVEVGLGGRLDATNVIDPIVSVISSLSLDHTSVLGDTLEKIAYEKAGIIKNGIPVVSATQKEEARRVIEKVANARNAPIIWIGKDILFAPLTHNLEKQVFAIRSIEGSPLLGTDIGKSDGRVKKAEQFELPLLGFHQVENAAVAYAALQICSLKGLPVGIEDIRRGFASVSWPGRFEILNHKPTIIVDSAHNHDSAQKLRKTLDDYFPDKPVVLLFGASEDKNVEGMFAELLPRVKKLIVTQSDHPRALEVSKLIEIAQHHGVAGDAIVPFDRAFERALQQADDEVVILVTGSIFIAAAARQTWLNKVERKS